MMGGIGGVDMLGNPYGVNLDDGDDAIHGCGTNHSGGEAFNTLEVISLFDINYPELVDSIAMQNPKGLGADVVNQTPLRLRRTGRP